MSETPPEVDALTLPLLPLTTGVVLPQMVVTLALETSEARQAADGALAGDRRVLLVPRSANGYTRVGTVARVENEGELPGGQRALVLRGLSRALVGRAVADERPGLWVEADPVAESSTTTGRARDMVREYRAVVRGIAEKLGNPRIADALAGVDDPGALADTAGWAPDLSVDRKVELLEELDPEARLAKALAWVRETLAELDVSEQIRNRVTEGMDKTQREFLLRQQMQAIREELGESSDADDVVAEYRNKLAQMVLPDEVRAAVEREVDRFERTSEQSPEHGWIRTWLDTVVAIPWGTRSEERLDVRDAREILDADHTGLDDVKDRIVEYLAVRKLRAERSMTDDSANSSKRRGAGAILALVGPPGVGKTSLGESVARALGREFVRVALGGVHDEAELRGHRRTYVGAQPGRIVRAIGEAKSMNPVILLDEVDKLSAGGWSGDPTAALLEVLDPAQNHTFRDHYLEVELDLSDVVFLATANTLDTIPAPLLDRMEVVLLDGYTEDEKLVIARNHLLPRQIERSGLRADEISITDDAIRAIVAGYTREAGVRSLERELGTLLRKVAAKIATATTTPVVVDETDLVGYLRRPKVHHEVADRVRDTPGVATGLAVTGAGGDVLFIEVSTGPGEPGLTLTGQLGDVMKESAQIALSWVRAHVEELGIDPSLLQQRVHVHVPAGAVPKDGPSAGITMTTALVSALTGRPVRPEIAMTGEVTLQGKVLPIGGVKQKVLAAHRSGVTEVILPRRNEDDIDDVPQRVRDTMTFHIADTVTQVLDWALADIAV